MIMDWPAILDGYTSASQFLVWADWLSEGGDEETAEGVRWLVRENRWPSHAGDNHFWSCKKRGYSDFSNSLPQDVFSKLCKSSGQHVGKSRWYATRYEAMPAAARAYGEVERLKREQSASPHP